MLDVKRYKIDNKGFYNYCLTDDKNKSLYVVFGGNGDLYFWCRDGEYNTKSEFSITKENMTIYNLFQFLFKKFADCEVFVPDDIELELCMDEAEKLNLINRKRELNEGLKVREEYKFVYSDDEITWVSDDSYETDFPHAHTLKIKNLGDSFKLEFTYYGKTDGFGERGIRFRNSGSRFDPFNLIFMDFFIKLQEYNPDYHQVDIEEMIYEETAKLVRKK